ncbi:hypothetical protein EOD41_12670 [Mucilaginibacter limnophilus]|uniref:SPW repeat-containing integral membrane domain-containing protein n=1 Tax=Mucilaginibacter limnophilus TaxID=1932778 RepID=A0A437MRQ1_9SPHI|nr:hypothetical protein [Mucilaginibacter limnophilus]RVU00331.1 hypothetical protein EOD41_12670 [Mucilaginibacter limnophilus]
MKAIISTRMHAWLDYIGGILITFSPWIFGFADLGGAPVFIPVCIGAMQLTMAIFSKHELGLFKVFPMQLHLVIDMFAGFILIVLPFVYGFYHMVYLPHVLLGALSFFAGLLTRHSPAYGLEMTDPRGFNR